ncbi:glycoside hydrolase family 13 protein [Glaciihabitans sp. dw_435]|uniref:glycoside hydrolase family 13 protein n=1 Tax=Glaciihabitans sp. dw_435 TaxID=2720081 RepID=UPI001BD1C096|nr:glycoside hydrolase family 13 protein [Glaciihabitans sp. dw_435]
MSTPSLPGLFAQPHHDGSPLYVSSSAPELGDVVRVRLRIPVEFGAVASVHTRSNPDHEPRFSEAVIAGTTDGADWWEAPVAVENPVHGYRFLITMVGGERLWVNATGVHTIETLDSEDFRLVTYPAPPEWAAATVLYQIFPDRFGRSNAANDRELPMWAQPAEWTDPVDQRRPEAALQFYGGDLAGIEEHLDHLERLGITMIYLTPVFPAQSNHRYDAFSFDVVDPLLGGDSALISLIEAAHKRGFKIIGDLTSNHSGDAHEWFRASHRNPGAAESEFYYWRDEAQETYASWLGVPSLPKLNWNSDTLRSRFIEGDDSVVAKWLKPPYNFDGWRIDVSNMTGRYLDEDHNTSVRRAIRKTMIDVNPDTILLGESTNDAAADFTGDSWHGAMTYANFTRPLWGWLSAPGSPAGGGLGVAQQLTPDYSAEQFYAAHVRFSAGFTWRVRLSNMNALDTHDTPRFLTHALPGVLPVALGLSMTLPGIPVVWAGDEFGLTGVDGEHSRTPMPWDNVDDARETIDLYATLIHLRTGHPALNGGGIRWLHAGDDVVVFVRESVDESVLVVAARSGFDVTLPASAAPGELGHLFGHTHAERADDGALRLYGEGPSFAAWQLPGVDLATVGFAG